MRIKPHKSRILVNFPDVGLKESWSPEQLNNLFQHKPSSRVHDVNYAYLDLIHHFLKESFLGNVIQVFTLKSKQLI